MVLCWIHSAWSKENRTDGLTRNSLDQKRTEGLIRDSNDQKRTDKGSRKKILFLVAGPLRGGGGANGCATKEKRTFFNVRGKNPIANKPRRGGG